MGVTGFEPVTSSMSTTHSNQLSYTPGSIIMLLRVGFYHSDALLHNAQETIQLKKQFSSGGGT